MPASVKDRPTTSHEYLFLLSKSAKYFYDADAVVEALAPSTVSRIAQNIESQVGSTRANAGAKTNGNMKAVVKRTVRSGVDTKGGAQAGGYMQIDTVTRNKRSVWTVATKPFKEAHFATFPPALVEPCIKAGCPAGGTVLDPFFGAGTTGLVATKLGRRYLGIELNPEYAAIAEARIQRECGLLEVCV